MSQDKVLTIMHLSLNNSNLSWHISPDVSQRVTQHSTTVLGKCFVDWYNQGWIVWGEHAALSLALKGNYVPSEPLVYKEHNPEKHFAFHCMFCSCTQLLLSQALLTPTLSTVKLILCEHNSPSTPPTSLWSSHFSPIWVCVSSTFSQLHVSDSSPPSSIQWSISGGNVITDRDSCSDDEDIRAPQIGRPESEGLTLSYVSWIISSCHSVMCHCIRAGK